ncbi:lysylphosphatidylglycerol synthase transmembrane domain-containing protein [Elusimicrobiota bacterium]
MKFDKRKLTLIIGIPLSILCLYLALRKVDFSKTLQLLTQTNYIYLLPAIILFIIDFLLRSLRWKVLLSPVKKCRYIDLLSTLYIGFFANSVLPMRMGEVIRAVMVGEKEKISKTSSIATIALERLLDGFAILILLIMAFFVFPFPENIKRIWIIGAFVFSFLLLLLYGLIYLRSFTLKVLTSLFKMLPNNFEEKIERLLDKFLAGLEILRKTRHFFLTMTISMGVWLADASVFYFVAKGMGIQQITFIGAIFIMAVIALGISIPSSPGYIGVYEYFGVLGCSILGIEKSSALSFILLTHIMQILIISIIGMFFLTREHISLFQLEKKAEAEES